MSESSRRSSVMRSPPKVRTGLNGLRAHTPLAPLPLAEVEDAMDQAQATSALTPAEQLAKEVITGKLTLAEAYQKQPNFIQDLPAEPTSVSEDGFDDAPPFYLGELCLKVSLEDAKHIASLCDPVKQDSICLYLAQPKHSLSPTDPRLAYFQGIGRRSSVMHSPPPTGGRPPEGLVFG